MTWLNWYWPIALVMIAGVMFAIPETIAIRYGGETFSAFMSKVNNSGPIGRLWLIAWGILIGGLSVHFNGWCVAQ